ncbi:hypothetical protein Tco_0749915 [Tanacetum coccineum]|uniref:Uncharacterized protein n=1 Tax=Tanacetum coccineum TaxID=301880 RepID=A0ABQ4YZS3_9ASTR
MPTSAPTSFPPLLLPSDSCREGRPEVNLPPRMGLGIALGPGYEVGESSAAAAARPAGGFRADYGFVATMDREIRRDQERYVGYGITDAWDEIVETLQGAPFSTDTELGAYMREFESMERLGVRAMEHSVLAHGEVISLRTTVHAQMSEITELQSADHRRQRAISDLLDADARRQGDGELKSCIAFDSSCLIQTLILCRNTECSIPLQDWSPYARTRQQQIVQTLTAIQTLQRETIPLQGLVTTLQGQLPEEAGSSS